MSRVAADVQSVHSDQLPGVFQPPSTALFPIEHNAALLEASQHHLWVGLNDGDVVGYLYAETPRKPASAIKQAADRLFIHQMAVLRAFRGRGIGTALLGTTRGFAEQHQHPER